MTSAKVNNEECESRIAGSVPLFCPVCEFVMNSADDIDSYSKYFCCFECEMKWAQSRSDMWNSGWRPEKKEIDEERAKRLQIPPSFQF